ncbi:unnamed protein product [Rhizophagus irregularis]|nr:unnamed protein product [Rhizophagus irregularis]
MINLNYTSKTIRSPFEVYSSIQRMGKLDIGRIRWIPYSQITNLKKIAEGGFSIIYKATWEGTDVAVKKLHDSQNISKYFLNELRSLYQCNDDNKWVIGCYGITQDPITREYMIILNYAEGGNLHNYLQKNFINITWNDKLFILHGISFGLDKIHKNNFIHRDFHSGNMLFSEYWKVGDLGLSQPANNALSNNEIYGVIPYIAPEIFKGAAFSKESDVYSFGSMISFNKKQKYMTREYEFDINNIQRSSIQNTNSATQSLIVPVNSSRKRNFKELKNETNENQKNRKYIKVDNSNDELLNIIELI